MLKLVYLAPLLLIFLIPQAFAATPLENEHFFAESATITLDLQFGEDLVRQTLTRTITTPTLDRITLTFYGDVIPIQDPELKVTRSGEHFRISSVPDGIVMYGHKNLDLDNYKINIYFASDNGLTKFPVTTAAPLQDDKTIERQPEEIKEQYIPKLIITTEHDFRTYWKETFDIEVMTYDENNNDRPDLNPFQGRVDGVDVTVILSLDDETITTLSGITEHGQWKGQYYFMENISAPGEYIVDVIASYLGKTASHTSSMFVIGTTTDSGSSSINNIPPTANAGLDQVVPHLSNVNLNGNGSSDPDGTIVSYSWIQTNGPPTVMMINNPNTATPNFDTVGAGETYIFELTVTDNKGASSIDTVTVTT